MHIFLFFGTLFVSFYSCHAVPHPMGTVPEDGQRYAPAESNVVLVANKYMGYDAFCNAHRRGLFSSA